MADIVQSLFGITPEMYQQRQAQQADAAALQYAQLTPMQQANFAIGRGAYQLAGALGGQDPQLQLISNRNAIARQIDYNNPESMMEGVNTLTQAGDTVGAMQLADVARKMQSEMAQRFQRTAAGQASLSQATREQRAPTTNELTNARAIALQAGAEGTPEYNAAFTAEYSRLTAPKEPKEPTTSELTNARALAALKGAPGTPEYNAEFQAQLARLTTKDVKEPTTSELTNARAIALQAGPVGSPEFNTAFMNEYNRLTAPKEPQTPDAIRQYEFAKTPAGGNFKGTFEQWKNTQAPRVEVRNIMPGDKALADIPAFRASVQRTIDPQLKAITATDQALQAINDSLATGNFSAYRAAQVQFAKAIAGAGDLSQKELKAAGADPSLLGGTADYLSTLFSSTPTADTQKKIRATLQAIRTVAQRQAQGEVDQQRKIALRSPGFNAEAVSEALMFPQLQAAPAAPAGGGSLAEQAAAELARRRAK
jgi:hypothetical protein